VVPYVHKPNFEMLDVATRSEIMELLTHATRVLDYIYHPAGYNMGANIGAAAGAGVASHVHFHLVPRWNGDTNFMTTLSDTRVIPEDLEGAYEHLCAWWAKHS
jgi:ATP adenylyltransferase